MSNSLTQLEIEQIEAEEPIESKKLFEQYLHEKCTLQQLADNNNMKLYHVRQYSRTYKYVARRKYHSMLKHQYKKNQYKFPACPECYNCNFKYDDLHHEVYCKCCGLVIIAPPSADFITDGYSYLHITTNFHNIQVVVE